MFRRFFNKEIKPNIFYHIVLSAVFIVALFLRVYRVDELLGFYYDQGRDALVVWRLWHEGKFFLIGPISGLPGLFLGPFYYYMIAPFYILGQGNPVFPAVFVSFLATLAIIPLYYLGWKMHSRGAGIIASAIYAFSYNLVLAGRWFSNPTPILLTSVLLLLTLWILVEKKMNGRWRLLLWGSIGLLIGISLQLESASAIFYIPMVVIFSLWHYKTRTNFSFKSGKFDNPGSFNSKSVIKRILNQVQIDRIVLSFSLLLFLLTLLPQIFFNFRHENLLFISLRRIIVHDKSFQLDFWQVLGVRLKYFWDVFYSKILPGESTITAIFSAMSLSALLTTDNVKLKKLVIPLLLIFLGTPVLGLIFFQGNKGNVYDYYMTGYYITMILFFSLGLGEIIKRKNGIFVIAVFFWLFVSVNYPHLKEYLTKGVLTGENITLGSQIAAVDWIIDDASERGEFNVDFYVPPIVPYSYDYLFLWRADVRKSAGKPGCELNNCGLVTDRQVERLYTPYEVNNVDWGHQHAWFERQDSIGKVVDEIKFGGITVQRRERY